MWRVASGVALTFDDGPDPEFTPALLDLLREVEVRATFFLIGSKALAHPELVARIVSDGHVIGGHGYDHEVITSMSVAELGKDLRRCRDALLQSAGVDTVLFRPPKGLVNLESIRSVQRHGYRLVHWSRTYSDYRRDGIDMLLGRMTQHPPAAGDVILLHDNNSYTIEALRRVLPAWKGQGMEFVHV